MEKPFWDTKKNPITMWVESRQNYNSKTKQQKLRCLELQRARTKRLKLNN